MTVFIRAVAKEVEEGGGGGGKPQICRQRAW